MRGFGKWSMMGRGKWGKYGSIWGKYGIFRQNQFEFFFGDVCWMDSSVLDTAWTTLLAHFYWLVLGIHQGKESGVCRGV